MKYYAIIVGGGSGTRMQHNVPKQFLLLNKKPLLMHTISAFYHAKEKPHIIVVLNKTQHACWSALCAEYRFSIPHQVTAGGKQRFYSVKSGLMAVEEEGLVAVHDAVRPLVSPKLISLCFEKALINGNAIAGIKASDSVRLQKENRSTVLNRDEIFLIQTPQTFKCVQLRKAYQQHYQTSFTDDATVVQAAGFDIHLVDGERSNFKITFPEDLELAQFILRKSWAFKR